jgi:hypothetical protein
MACGLSGQRDGDESRLARNIINTALMACSVPFRVHSLNCIPTAFLHFGSEVEKTNRWRRTWRGGFVTTIVLAKRSIERVGKVIFHNFTAVSHKLGRGC